MKQIARILKYLHTHGYCLNNLSTGNFLIIKREVPYKSMDKSIQIYKELHVKVISLNKAIKFESNIGFYEVNIEEDIFLGQTSKNYYDNIF